MTVAQCKTMKENNAPAALRLNKYLWKVQAIPHRGGILASLPDDF